MKHHACGECGYTNQPKGKYGWSKFRDRVDTNGAKKQPLQPIWFALDGRTRRERCQSTSLDDSRADSAAGPSRVLNTNIPQG